MNEIILVESIDLRSENNPTYEMFFMLGDMPDRDTNLKIIDVIDGCKCLSKQDILFVKDGFVVKINRDDIPKLIKRLVDNDILVYSVYRSYNSPL